MWTKQQSQAEPAPPAQAAKPSVVAFSNPPAPALGGSPALGSSPARGSARLGSSLQIKGHITGTEDLQIDGKVDGPISLRGHALTVGPAAQLTSEIHAREVVVYGKVIGNVHSRDRVDVKTDGSVVGDISTARISIEDGAQFKGRIEIDPTKSHSAAAD
jgi:cytoskeletal protein CcmA (bactofilin family)